MVQNGVIGEWTLDPDLVMGEFHAVCEKASNFIPFRHKWTRTVEGVQFIYAGSSLSGLIQAVPDPSAGTWRCRTWILPSEDADPASVVLALTVMSATERPYSETFLENHRSRPVYTRMEREALEPGYTAGETVYRAMYLLLGKEQAAYRTEFLRGHVEGLSVKDITLQNYINVEGVWHGYFFTFSYHHRSFFKLDIHGPDDSEYPLWQCELKQDEYRRVDSHTLPLYARAVLNRLEGDDGLVFEDDGNCGVISETDLTMLIAGAAQVLKPVPFIYSFPVVNYVEEPSRSAPMHEYFTANGFRYVRTVAAFSVEEALADLQETDPDLVFFSEPVETDCRAFPEFMPSFTANLPN